MPRAYSLIDCNNFYASCERVFEPSLRNRPVVILSNNDGCVIARSAEAKELDIPMGIPEFKVRPLISRKNIVVKSSNYALYGDMSNRVMETLRTITPNLEVYSIDEAFAEINTSSVKEFRQVGKKIVERVRRWTGLPVSVGIAPTKTLAKVANETAKKNLNYEGVLTISKKGQLKTILKQTPAADVWGIGRKYTKMLHRYGIESAWDLSQQPDSWVRSEMKVTGLRTVWELRGKPCLSIEHVSEPRKGILSSRSFGKPIKNVVQLQEAVSAFASRAAEKLRAQECLASNISVVLVTDKYRNPGQPYKFGADESIPNPTANTSKLAAMASAITERLFDSKKTYKKAWVMLTGIIPEQEVQADLFSQEKYSGKEHRLMESLDHINARFGKRSLLLASTGIEQKWQMKQQYLSKRYTTRWDELMEV